MGGATPVCNEKNILEVPLELYFLTRTMKSRQNAILLSDGAIFFSISEYAAMLREFNLPKKGKELSLSFGWQIYIMVEPRILWSYEI